MSAIITPFVQKETGVALFSVSQQLRDMLQCNKRFLLSPLPYGQAEDTPDGIVELNYSLAAHPSLAPFFASQRTGKVAGGSNGLLHWLRGNVSTCQSPERQDCCHHITYSTVGDSALCLCWHHDNEIMMRGPGALKETLISNRVNWILSWVATELQLPPGRDLSMAELVFWALRRGLIDELPEEAGRIALCHAKEEDTGGVRRESDIVWSVDAIQLLKDAQPALVKMAVDDDSGLLYMRNPKPIIGKSAAYLRFVASMPCACCNGKVTTPFLFRAPGLNEHVRWYVPLCDNCSQNAMPDVKAWERANGLHLYVVANKTFDYAIERGVVSFGE